ncbi:hypothetical protein DACRYDRAFT_20807 [Dacryopinax primogenitus]|uniref:Uncharacterized protein n=1 Tax=Dacryopinax primogenitus (strain DJM 731) TaxID=1858805 RepID=M5G684_DACPD|nr:uncharacterized protein DACRYDRAFT_20807 [Dacryopinax primogenitus]EJU04194.1 hypothetical protein DACRYDRAFT_20807 [Dacryopinax primogenitus]
MVVSLGLLKMNLGEDALPLISVWGFSLFQQVYTPVGKRLSLSLASETNVEEWMAK